MLHALALVKIKDGGAEDLFEPFFQVTFVDGHFTAQRLDGDGLADMLHQHFPGLDYFFPVGRIGQELAGKSAFFFPEQAVHRVQQQYLRLRVDEDVLESVGIGMVQKAFNGGPCLGTKRQLPGKRRLVVKGQHFFGERGELAVPGELRQVGGRETETQYVHALDLFNTAARGIEFTEIAFGLLFTAIKIAAHAEPQFKAIDLRVVLFIMIHQHARVVNIPLRLLAVSFDGIINGARYHTVNVQ